MPVEPLLSVVIVSWNVAALLERALASVYRAWNKEEGSLQVIVVDNGSRDGTQAMLREHFPDTRLIANAGNRGFTAANNQGLAEATGRFVLLLNPDTEVLGDALHSLITCLEGDPGIGVVGPRLLNPDGSEQSSRRRFPSLGLLFFESTWLQRLAPRAALRRFYVEDQLPTEAQDVDWVTGAAMLVRRELIEQIGGLDEQFFMYSEELDWCRRIRAAGWRVRYWPQAAIIHHEGKSSEQVVAPRHIYFQSSKVLYAAKYHGRAAAGALRLWLLSQYVWQAAIEGLKWLVGHRRALRAERLRAYRAVLRSGLRQRGPLEAPPEGR